MNKNESDIIKNEEIKIVRVYVAYAFKYKSLYKYDTHKCGKRLTKLKSFYVIYRWH